MKVPTSGIVFQGLNIVKSKSNFEKNQTDKVESNISLKISYVHFQINWKC
jgi:hypothetical protein